MIELIGRPKSEADTPCLLLDMDLVEANIEEMARRFKGRACQLRPHVKTHKLPLIALAQIKAGAIGVTCAKLSEAEIFFEHGVDNILVANVVAGETKLRRLARLARDRDLTVCVDDPQGAAQISAAAREAGTRIKVLVEVNVGINRCGVAPGEPALDLAREVAGLDNLIFKGVMGYEGGMFLQDPEEKARRCDRANRLLVDTAELIRRNHIPVEIVSAGGSNTHLLTGLHPGITEIQVGSYVTMDRHNQDYGLDFHQALTVLATVISRPEPGRAVIDAGMKALSLDAGLPVCLDEGLTLTALNEEHGHLAVADPGRALSPGDKVELVPSHGCTTIPLHDHYVITRGGRIESLTPIAARGALT